MCKKAKKNRISYVKKLEYIASIRKRGIKIEVKVLFLFILCFRFYGIEAQGEVDSMQLNQWTEKYQKLFKDNQEKALSGVIHITDSLLSDERSSPIARTWMLYEASKYSFRLFKLDSAARYARLGLLNTTPEIEVEKAGFYNIIGTTYTYKSRFDSAAFYLTKAGKLLEKYGENEKAGFVYNNIANIYFEEENFSSALTQLKQAEENILSDSLRLSSVYGNISYAYVQLDSLKQANLYADKAISLSKEVNDSRGAIYGNLSKSDIARDEGRYDDAVKYSRKAYTLADLSEDTYRRAIAASSIFLLLKDTEIDNAIPYGEEAYNYFIKDQPRFSYDVSLGLSNAYERKKDYGRAHEYLKFYTTYLDSIRLKESTTMTLELLEKYESEKKQKIIAEQSSILTAKDLRNARLATAVIVLALLSLLSFLYYFMRSRLQRKKMDLLKSEYEVNLMQALIEGEQQERKRLARDIHDGIANEIAATKMYLNAHPLDEASGSVIKKQLDKLHKEARRTAHNMLPLRLEEQTFLQYLETYKDDKKPLLDIHIIDKGYKNNKSKSLEHFLFRLIQEIIGNTLRHGQAKSSTIILQDDGKTIEISVADDGVGFDMEEKKEYLSFIKNRLKDINGKIVVDSSMGSGVKINIKIDYAL